MLKYYSSYPFCSKGKVSEFCFSVIGKYVIFFTLLLLNIILLYNRILQLQWLHLFLLHVEAVENIDASLWIQIVGVGQICDSSNCCISEKKNVKYENHSVQGKIQYDSYAEDSRYQDIKVKHFIISNELTLLESEDDIALVHT